MTPEEKAVVQAAIAWRNSLDSRSHVRIVDSPEDRLLNATSALVYACDDCNYDRNTCPGCGENIGHGDGCCTECRETKADEAHPCTECLTDPNEDPAPWCDCLRDETCKGPCRQRAHHPYLCPNRQADIPYNVVMGGESLVVSNASYLCMCSRTTKEYCASDECHGGDDVTEWTLSEWQHVIMGDVVRLPGRSETEASVGSARRQPWHADSREYTGQDGKVRDWVTPHEHEIVFARLILDGGERTVNFPPETPVEILMSASRRAALTIQQAFPGSEVMS